MSASKLIVIIHLETPRRTAIIAVQSITTQNASKTFVMGTQVEPLSIKYNLAL
jgi:hypothetical protein